MEIIEVVNCVTDDRKPITLVEELIGKPKPYAYLLDYESYGYAKFKIDNNSLSVYE